MAEERSVLEEIRRAVTETNRILRVAFSDQLKAAVARAASKAMGEEDDQIAISILNHLLLRPRTAEELSGAVGSQYGVSRRTIQRRLEKFVEARLITMERRGGSVEYVLQMEALE